MSLEETVRTLLDDAVPLLRRAVQNATVDALVTGVTEPVRGLLRRAYEVGYREGLAARPGEPSGGTAEVATAPTNLVPDVPTAAPAPPVGSAVRFDDDEDDFEKDEPGESAPATAQDGERIVGSSPVANVDWSGEDSAGRDRRRAAPSLRIFPHATVGTLRERIIDAFDLERFDIDVVIARKGDRSRRQLKATVKLSKYVLEGER